MRNYFIIWSLVLGLISTVQAQTQTYTLINGIKVDAVAVSSARIASNGEVIQGIQFRAQSGTTPPKFYERAVQFGKGTTGASIKNFSKRNAFQIGLTLGMLGIGWAMDELTGQIYSQSGQSSTCIGSACITLYGGPLGGSYNSCNNGCLTSTSQLTSIAKTRITAVESASRLPITCSSFSGQVPQGGTVYCTTVSGSARNVTWGMMPSTTPTQTVITSEPVSATDTQIAEQVVPKLSPSALPKLHTDPVTGAVQKTQEVLNKKADVANEYARELNPSSVNQTAPTASPLPTTTEKPATDTLPQVGSISLPDFCSWATTVCAWLDWTKDTGTKASDTDYKFTDSITVVDVPPETYDSGIGTGSCPSPASFVVYGSTISYSYQPVCDLASIARIFVLISAYLSSIYIVMGIKR